MARRKITPWDKDPNILARLTRVAKLRAKGVPVEEIAAKESRSVAQIYVDLQHINERWRERSERKLEEIKAEQLAEIREVKRSAWDTFEAAAITNKNKVEALNTLLKAIEREAKIHGTDAPTAISADVHVTPHEQQPVSPAEVREYIRSLAFGGFLPGVSLSQDVLPADPDPAATALPLDG